MAKTKTSFKKGHKGGPGRPKGTKNHNSTLFRKVLEGKGFNLVEELLEMYHHEKTQSQKKAKAEIQQGWASLANSKLKTMARYSYPALKSIEAKIDNTSDLQNFMLMSPEERQEMRDKLEKRRKKK